MQHISRYICLKNSVITSAKLLEEVITFIHMVLSSLRCALIHIASYHGWDEGQEAQEHLVTRQGSDLVWGCLFGCNGEEPN